MRVERVDASATHDLRRRILRDGRPDAEVTFPEDDRPGAFHLGVRAEAGGRLVAVASFSPEAAAHRPGRRAVRLRGMAVEPGLQGRGIGQLLMDEAVARLRAGGVEVLWANARDSALGFYERCGMEVVGERFLTEIGLPHHVVVMDIGESGTGGGARVAAMTEQPTHQDVTDATTAAQATMRPQTVPVNVYETTGALVVVAPLPAVTADDVTIELRPGKLRLYAYLRSAAPRDYLVHEWDYGGYEREIDVPDGFGSGVEASLANGQLAIRILRGEPAGPVTVKPAPAG